MRLPIPPAWRDLLRGGPDNWQLLAIAAAVLGGAWVLSPYATAEKVREAHDRRVGRPPNATGRALGLTAGQLADPVQDPIEVLTLRTAVARAGSRPPVYRGSRRELFPEYLASPPEVTWPMPAQNLRALGAQQPFRGVPIQAGPGVSITAADVLNAQLGARKGAAGA